jgi:polysaccharide export outer membrane protein
MRRANRSYFRSLRICTIMLVALIFALTPLSLVSASEYRINIGDILELSASSVPDFRHRATVDSNGDAFFQLIGVIPARGRSVKEILKEIQESIPKKALRRRAPDGNEQEIIIGSDEISLTIAEYSPVYVQGDVSNPGSYPFRPGLTVRQAVALAGGYDTMRIRMENPYLMAADLRSEIKVLGNEFAQEQARIARLQTELGLPAEASNISPYSPTAVEIGKLEAEQLDIRNTDFQKEKQYLSESIRSMSSNLNLLEKQMQTEAENAKVDQEDLDRVEGLVAKGMAPITRLSETKRLVLLSASRATEIEARLEQVKQQRAEEERKLQRLMDQRRMELLNQLQEEKIKYAATASKMAAAAEKMLLVGALRSQIGRGGNGSPDIVVFRGGVSGAERIVATADTELLPRDVVEIALSLDSLSKSDRRLPTPGLTDQSGRLGAFSDGTRAQ